MKIFDKPPTLMLVAILVAVFGGFYTFITDISLLLPFVGRASQNLQVVIRISLSALIAFFVFAGVLVSVRLKSDLSKLFGFLAVSDKWFPDDTDERMTYSRNLFQKLIMANDLNLFIASVSGEWDICKPFTAKELTKLFKENKCKAKILLSHPESNGLRERCEKESGQDLGIMKNKIINNTHFLKDIGGENCEIRWYLTPPIFHILGNDRVMHFSPFVDGIRGHDTRRYVVSSENSIYKSFKKWFDETWEKALNPNHEFNWVTKQASSTRAVFLDRDDTLIKDICYFGNSQEANIDILPGVIEGLKIISEKGYRLIVVSNQQPVGLKINSDIELALLTKRIKNEFEFYGIYFDAFYYCKHTVSANCNCRKPKPQLFEIASKDFCLHLDECHFIGDSLADKEVKRYLPQLKIHIIDNDNFLKICKNICSEH